MNKREILLIIAVVAALIAVSALTFFKTPPPPHPIEAPKSSEMPTQSAAPATSTEPNPALVDSHSQLSLKTMSKEEAVRVYLDRMDKDHQADWKVPINFYGKVVDENEQPVAGANVHFEWNTIGTPGNSAEGSTTSDGGGLFSLTGQHGKILEVRVEKEGYYIANGIRENLFFEYADPSNEFWYEPDSAHPVIFHLRKKGEGAKLFTKTLSIGLNNDHPQKAVDLMQGFVVPEGQLIIQEDKSKWLPGAQPFPWTVNLSMREGGLVETENQFPFLAPSGGYSPAVTIDMTNLDRNVWRGSILKTYYFYLPSTNTYGRIAIDASAFLPIQLNFSYNLTPGSHILEPAAK